MSYWIEVVPALPPQSTSMRKLFVVILLSVCIWANAQTAEVLAHPGSEVFKVVFQSPELTSVKVELQSQRGKTLLTQEVSSQGFMKPYNLQNLPNGNYKFIIAFNGETVVRPITLGTPKVAKEKKERRVKLKGSDRIMIAEVDQDVEISLVDESIEALSIFFYLEGTEDFEYFYWEPTENKKQSYDLSKFQASEIRIEVVENGKILAEKEIAKNW